MNPLLSEWEEKLFCVNQTGGKYFCYLKKNIAAWNPPQVGTQTGHFYELQLLKDVVKKRHSLSSRIMGDVNFWISWCRFFSRRYWKIYISESVKGRGNIWIFFETRTFQGYVEKSTVLNYKDNRRGEFLKFIKTEEAARIWIWTVAMWKKS